MTTKHSIIVSVLLSLATVAAAQGTGQTTGGTLQLKGGVSYDEETADQLRRDADNARQRADLKRIQDTNAFLRSPNVYRITKVGEISKQSGMQTVNALRIDKIKVSTDGSVELGQIVEGSGMQIDVPPGSVRKGDLVTFVDSQVVEVPEDHFDPLGTLAEAADPLMPGNGPAALKKLSNELAAAADQARKNALTAADHFGDGLASAAKGMVDFLAQPRGDFGRPGAPVRALWDYLNNDAMENDRRLYDGAVEALDLFQRDPARFFGEQVLNMPLGELGKAEEVAKVAAAARRITQAEKNAAAFTQFERGAAQVVKGGEEANAAQRAATEARGGTSAAQQSQGAPPRQSPATAEQQRADRQAAAARDADSQRRQMEQQQARNDPKAQQQQRQMQERSPQADRSPPPERQQADAQRREQQARDQQQRVQQQQQRDAQAAADRQRAPSEQARRAEQQRPEQQRADQSRQSDQQRAQADRQQQQRVGSQQQREAAKQGTANGGDAADRRQGAVATLDGPEQQRLTPPRQTDAVAADQTRAMDPLSAEQQERIAQQQAAARAAQDLENTRPMQPLTPEQRRQALIDKYGLTPEQVAEAERQGLPTVEQGSAAAAKRLEGTLSQEADALHNAMAKDVARGAADASPLPRGTGTPASGGASAPNIEDPVAAARERLAQAAREPVPGQSPSAGSGLPLSDDQIRQVMNERRAAAGAADAAVGQAEHPVKATDAAAAEDPALQAVYDQFEKTIALDARWAGVTGAASAAALTAGDTATTPGSSPILKTLRARYGNDPKDAYHGAGGLLQARLGVPVPATQKSVEKALKIAGDGSRGIVFGYDQNGDRTMVNVRQAGDRVEAIDARTGNPVSLRTMTGMYFYRTN
jgi:hypothetical protein